MLLFYFINNFHRLLNFLIKFLIFNYFNKFKNRWFLVNKTEVIDKFKNNKQSIKIRD